MRTLSSKKAEFNKYFYLIIFIILSFLSLQIQVFALKETHYTKQWIKDSEFNSSSGSWFKIYNGDSSDLNAYIHSGKANFEVSGEKNTYSLIADPPLASNWIEMDNPSFPNRPDVDEITSKGCRVSHDFDDQSPIQSPSVHWDRNITMPVNMSDYIITSASIQARVNATVDKNLDRYYDFFYHLNARIDPPIEVDQYGNGDYVRFYVLLSDLEKNKVYEIANLQTVWLGSGGAPGTAYLYDTYMISVPQEDLIYYLSSTLSTDFNNFTITLGMRLQIEDNVGAYLDRDTFNELIINFVNLTFIYEKKIDQSSSVSWNQIGNSIKGERVEIQNATFQFAYKIDQSWPLSLSLNSKMNVFINNYEYDSPIKLYSMNTSFQELRIKEAELIPYIVKNINISLSIQVFVADKFVLDHPITISIDDVYLEISYSVWEETKPASNNFIWIILIILMIIIGILAVLSLRSYVILPHKQKISSYLRLRTQKFKDINNIQGIILIHRASGLPIYSYRYSSLMKGKKILFSGFLQAISVIGEEISREEFKKRKIPTISEEIDYNKIIELDLKQFYCLVLDLEELRTVLILKSRSSKRLKKVMFNFTLALYLKISKKLEQFDNDLTDYPEIISPLLDEYFELDYKKDFITYHNEGDIQDIKRKFKLSKLQVQVMNIIFSLLKENRIFRLMDVMEKFSEKDEDLIFDTIETLIEYKLILPSTR
ncbi:MAG: hypothetical protein ACFFB0_18700 [Promethearchaeota archaeon]